MELYAAIDLHSNNSVLVVLDAEDHVVFAKRLRNDLQMIVTAQFSDIVSNASRRRAV